MLFFIIVIAAVVCLLIAGRKISCMDQLIAILPEKTNSFCFFGEEYGKVIDEQQISGHSWYLRGLLEYYQQFGDERAFVYLLILNTLNSLIILSILRTRKSIVIKNGR